MYNIKFYSSFIFEIGQNLNCCYFGRKMLLLFCFGCLLWEDWEHFGRMNWAICSCSNTLSLWIDCGFCFKTLPPLKKKNERKFNSHLHLLLFKKKLLFGKLQFYFCKQRLCLFSALAVLPNESTGIEFARGGAVSRPPSVCQMCVFPQLSVVASLKRAISRRLFSLISQSSVWLLAGIFPLWFHRGCLPKHHTCDSRESVCLFVV